AEAGDGGNFKTGFWTKAAVEVNEVHTVGAMKTSTMCRTKWTAIKKTYTLVEIIRHKSGWIWDDKGGAGITASSKSVWDAFEKKNPGSSRFRNAGW
ncbi:hypothetical protein SCHPADRAFT_807544, partial [Schizopora paradoxa]